MNSELLNEIYRIHQLSGIKTNKVLIESNLILEAGVVQGIERFAKGIEKFLDRNTTDVVDRFVGAATKRGETIELRLTRWITKMMKTADGQEEIRKLLYNMGESSASFAEKLVKANKADLDSLITAQRSAKQAKELIKVNLGEKIANAWEKTRAKPVKSSVKKPIIIPTEVNSKEKVKGFQDWLDDTHPDWTGPGQGRLDGLESKGYGIYGTKTKKAWETHSDEYLEILKRDTPPVLRTEEDVMKFQDWLEKYHPDWTDTPLERLKTRGYGTLGPKTRAAYEKYSKDYYETLSGVEKIRSTDITNLNPSEELKWLNSRLASNKTVLNLIRRQINAYLIKYEQKAVETSVKIDNIFSDILKSINKTSGDFKNLNSDEMITDLRNTATKIGLIKEVFKADKDMLYNEIEGVLMDNLSGEAKEKAVKVMEQLREVDPFRAGRTDEKWLSRSQAFQFLDNTATQQTIYNVGRIFKAMFTKGMSVADELRELTSRAITFIGTGSPKSWKEVGKYFDELGPTEGVKKLALHIWYATHLGLPLGIATAQMFRNMLFLSTTAEEGTEHGTVENSWWSNFIRTLKEQYSGYPFYGGDDFNAITAILGLLSPGHFFLDDIIRYMVGEGDEIEQGKKRPEATPQQLLDLYKKYNIPEELREQIRIASESKTAEEAERIIQDAIKKIPEIKPKTPTVTYTNNANGLIMWIKANGVNYNGETGKYKGQFKTQEVIDYESKEYVKQNGDKFTWDDNANIRYTFSFKDGNFTQESAGPKPVNETIKKNNMKRILETKIHNILKKQLNEQGRTLPAWVADYPCISQYTLSATGDDNKVYEVSQSGKWYYFKGGKYKREENGVISTGTWKCETGDKLRVRLPSLNTQWTEEKNWHKISNYTKCPETLPIKQWCKNDTIKQVQACLKMPIEYQTGNFGKYTKGYLESRDQSGTTITKDTIINVCGPNHPLSVGLVGTSGSGASGTPNTGAS